MPEPTELLVVATLVLLVGAAAAVPLRRRSAGAPFPAALDDATIRHRVALDALRDLEADRQAGSLDAASYAANRRQAEAEAAETLRALDAAGRVGGPDDGVSTRSARGALAVAGSLVAAAVLIGLFLPAPLGIANRTLDPRQDRIAEALVRFEANESDPQAISDLADAYLAGETLPDLERAQAALVLLINLQPANASAYARLATAQLRVGALDAASQTLDRMAAVAADSPDLPFLRGLVARENGDAEEARRQFALFIEAAPDDPRVPMVRALLDGA
ncbi:MAG: tetratricopeptide repeat protein [Chloroflexota bacterium]